MKILVVVQIVNILQRAMDRITRVCPLLSPSRVQGQADTMNLWPEHEPTTKLGAVEDLKLYIFDKIGPVLEDMRVEMRLGMSCIFRKTSTTLILCLLPLSYLVFWSCHFHTLRPPVIHPSALFHHLIFGG